MRRFGTVVGLALMAYALYRAVTPPSNHCPQSTPQRGYACDAGPPSHPHFLFWLLVAARRAGDRRRIAPLPRLPRGQVTGEVGPAHPPGAQPSV